MRQIPIENVTVLVTASWVYDPELGIRRLNQKMLRMTDFCFITQNGDIALFQSVGPTFFSSVLGNESEPNRMILSLE